MDVLPFFEREQLIWLSPLPPSLKIFLLALNQLANGEGRVAKDDQDAITQMTSTAPSEWVQWAATLKAQGILTETNANFFIHFQSIPRNHD